MAIHEFDGYPLHSVRIEEKTMSKQGFRNLALGLGPLLVAALLIGDTSPASAQNPAAPSGGPQEGIQVHGDWTLTVRDPNGTLAGTYEFKNALAINGGADRLLAQVLGGETVAGKWTVTLIATAPICGANNSCVISESGTPHASNSKDLTRAVAASGPDAGKFVLRGSVRMSQSGTISVAGTSMGTCAPSVAPAACLSISGGQVTQKILSPGVPVVEDQLVEVKVVISFS